MKSGTESKSKFRQLKRRLQLRYWQVVGVLETLWRVTQADAPAGDIGKLDNDEIAAALEWEGDPNTLINALIETHWIDTDEEFRLIIHDWSEHAPNHLQGAFKKHGKPFADQVAKQRNGNIASDDAKHNARDTAKHNAREGAIAPCPSTMPKAPCLLTKPNQTKPNQTKPPPTPGQQPEEKPGLVVAGGGDVWTVDSEAHARLSLQVCGYKRQDELLGQCRDRGLKPQDVISVCDEFKSNRPKFESPGAIAERLRTGFWPVDGVVSPEQAESKSAKKSKETSDAKAMALIRAGRQAKKSDDSIRAELAAAGLEWPK